MIETRNLHCKYNYNFQWHVSSMGRQGVSVTMQAPNPNSSITNLFDAEQKVNVEYTFVVVTGTGLQDLFD